MEIVVYAYLPGETCPYLVPDYHVKPYISTITWSLIQKRTSPPGDVLLRFALLAWV